MDLNLKEKVLIVTGGASGIGDNIARSLLAEGAIVFVLDKTPKEKIVFSEELKRYPNHFFYITTELTKKEQCIHAIDQVIRKSGKINGLVNNAGLNDGVGLEHGNYQKFIESLEKNVGHYETMTALCLPFLKYTGGAIANICSKTAETGQGDTSGYAAANGARMELTRAWADAFAEDGVRVNAVVVAECWTPQYEWWIGQLEQPDEKLAQINSRIPFENRMTTTEEIAAMVLFLLSDKSTGVNGQLLHVDGGYVHLDRAIRGTSV